MANPRLIQGRHDTALRDHLREIAKRHELALTALISVQLSITIDELRNTTPRWTGAGAGNPTGRPRYKSHPGWGMRIGNEPGDTGWQIMSTDKQHWAITNPMWVPYLRKVNYEHPTQANFLETAIRNLRERMKNRAQAGRRR